MCVCYGRNYIRVTDELHPFIVWKLVGNQLTVRRNFTCTISSEMEDASATTSLEDRAGENSRTSIWKTGYVMYSGTPKGHFQCDFQTRQKLDAIPVIQEGDSKETIARVVAERREVIGQIINNLRGEALGVAMEIGISRLSSDDGGYLLLKKMLHHVFPTWMDVDAHLGELILDAADLEDWERQMIITAAGEDLRPRNVQHALAEHMYGKDTHGKGKQPRQRKGVDNDSIPPEFSWSAAMSWIVTMSGGFDDEVDDKILADQLNMLSYIEDVCFLDEHQIVPIGSADRARDIANRAWGR